VGATTGLTALTGCGEQPLSMDYWKRNEQVLSRQTEGSRPENLIDQGILQMVRDLGTTLHPAYRDGKKRKLGWIEFSDIDRETVTAFDNYVTHEASHFAFMLESIGASFKLVERFLLEKVLHELKFEQGSGYIDPNSAKQFGKIHGLDVIASGVTTVSPDYIDISAKIIETQEGGVVAVGKAKVPFNDVSAWHKQKNVVVYKRNPKNWQ
jgi:hypothetical protein